MSFLLAARAFLSRVPAWAWVALASVVLLLVLRAHWIDVGADRERLACQDRMAAIKAAQDAEDARRQAEADKAAAAASKAAQRAVTDTREETEDAVERVRVEWRERVVRVPADCRNQLELPPIVREEGRAAVERARGALQR